MKEVFSFKVSINSWQTHNPGHKKGYRYFRFYSGFFSDNAVANLSHKEINFYIFLLCASCEAGVSESPPVINISLRNIPQIFNKYSTNIEKILTRLQENQLLTFEKVGVNRIERIERKENIKRKTRLADAAEDKPLIKNTNTDDLTEEKNHLNEQAQTIVELWNACCGELPKCMKVTERRKTQLLAQLKKYPDLRGHWGAVVDKWRASEFVMTRWRPSIDDFLNEGKRIKTLEGKYDDKK